MKTNQTPLIITENTLTGGYFINNNNCIIQQAANGLRIIDNFTVGCSHSVHPSISSTGSVLAMKKLGYWTKGDDIRLFRGFQYNMSRVRVSDSIDLLALHLEKGLDIDEHATGYAFSLLDIE